MKTTYNEDNETTTIKVYWEDLKTETQQGLLSAGYYDKDVFNNEYPFETKHITRDKF